MTTPAIDSLATYGGAMTNYAPVEDPTTDRDAAAANQAYASIAAVTNTAPRSIVVFKPHTTTGAMSLTSHRAMWGSDVSVAPVLARATTGTYTVTLPATITDELGVVHTIALFAAHCTSQNTTVASFINCVVSSNVITVYTFNAGGSLADVNSAVNLTLVAY